MRNNNFYILKNCNISMDVPEKLKKVTKELEQMVTYSLKKANKKSGDWIPLTLAEILMKNDLIKVTEDLSSTWTAGSGNDVLYGLTDSGKKLYDELVGSGYYDRKIK